MKTGGVIFILCILAVLAGVGVAVRQLNHKEVPVAEEVAVSQEMTKSTASTSTKAKMAKKPSAGPVVITERFTVGFAPDKKKGG